jgi:hypothetical protein
MRYEFTRENRKKWIANQLEFLRPLTLVVAALYIPPILAVLGSPDHIVSFSDFVPSSSTVTAIVLYLVNALYYWVRKWANNGAK